MLIGVLSDTHGDLKLIDSCIASMKDCGLLIHAGDFYEDSQKAGAMLNLRSVGVTGNCDYMVKGPAEEMVTLENKKIYVTHGHLYRVKTDMSPLVHRAKALGAQVAVFGHTHIPTVFRKDGVLFVNPGSLHRPPPKGAPTFALLEVTKSKSPQAKIVAVKRAV